MNSLSRAALPPSVRARTVTAVLGPTNTGKTHLAIDRMLAHRTGLIGLPLRLLAREVYGRIAARVGEDKVALVTGEEKIAPAGAAYVVSTVEAMPQDADVDFVAIDEVQLAGDLERGRVFTDRILRMRGAYETLLLGAATARPLLEKLLPGVSVVTRPRMSILQYTGQKKLTRLPPRSAVVAFSANEVYAIAELIRRMRGGTAIVMGALSPRTRNAQVELFQAGDVDFLIATDAIGMGLNLDVDHVAFASDRKFDGYQFRRLTSGELAQVAGRAGRHMRDGTFGVTARVSPFEDELVESLESHQFPPVKVFQWRNADLDFSSVGALTASLDETPREEGLTRAPPAEDQTALAYVLKDADVRDAAVEPALVERLWEVCQIPDYRKIAPANHGELVLALFRFLANDGRIPDDWFARQVRHADSTHGDIDTLSNRVAHIRTWTYIANRNDWLDDPVHWRNVTREIEDRLSDALHERLVQRFVDRRTSVLMKRLRENKMLESEVTEAGDVIVEGHRVGTLSGFRFQPEAAGEATHDKALRAAAAKVLTSELDRRAERLSAAPDTQFALGSDGVVRWQGAPVARIVASDDTLRPDVIFLADEALSAPLKERAEARVGQWLRAHVEGLLKPLFDLRAGEGLEGVARGVAFQIAEALGLLSRQKVAGEVKGLDQTARASLRAKGVRFGAYNIYVPMLLKPGPSQLIAQLWSLRHGGPDTPGLSDLPQLSHSGRTSLPHDPSIPEGLYRAVGFQVVGKRAVRVDILERLADQIRPLIAWRPAPEAGDPPPGAISTGGGFLVTVSMTSLLGCSGEDFNSVLKALGYRVERRPATEEEKARVAAARAERARPAPERLRVKEQAARPPAADAAPQAGSTASEAEAEAATGPVPAPLETTAAVETAVAGEPAAAAEAAAAAPTADAGEPQTVAQNAADATAPAATADAGEPGTVAQTPADATAPAATAEAGEPGTVAQTPAAGTADPTAPAATADAGEPGTVAETPAEGAADATASAATVDAGEPGTRAQTPAEGAADATASAATVDAGEPGTRAEKPAEGAADATASAAAPDAGETQTVIVEAATDGMAATGVADAGEPRPVAEAPVAGEALATAPVETADGGEAEAVAWTPAAGTAEAAGTDGKGEPAEGEEVLIEIWRPQRNQGAARGPRRRGAQQGGRGDARGAEGRGGEGRQRGGEPRRGPSERGGEPGERGRGEQRREGEEERVRKADERPRGRPDGKGGGEPRKRDRRPEPNPDSPFAALKSLKDDLERRQRGG